MNTPPVDLPEQWYRLNRKPKPLPPPFMHPQMHRVRNEISILEDHSEFPRTLQKYKHEHGRKRKF